MYILILFYWIILFALGLSIDASLEIFENPVNDDNTKARTNANIAYNDYTMLSSADSIEKQQRVSSISYNDSGHQTATTAESDDLYKFSNNAILTPLMKNK